MLEYPTGTWLFCMPNVQGAIDRAKEYIAKEGYTNQNVKIYKNEQQVYVVKI